MGKHAAFQKLSSLKCVILDRDGVINRKLPEGQYARCWGDVEILPGVPEAIARFNARGLLVLVVTNQRGVALGLNSEQSVREIHERLNAFLASYGAEIKAFYYCPHEIGTCNCRKPAPGLIEQAFEEFPVANPSNSLLVGDSPSDIEAAARLGMRSVFVWGDPSRRKPGGAAAARAATICVNSLSELATRFF